MRGERHASKDKILNDPIPDELSMLLLVNDHLNDQNSIINVKINSGMFDPIDAGEFSESIRAEILDIAPLETYQIFKLIQMGMRDKKSIFSQIPAELREKILKHTIKVMNKDEMAFRKPNSRK